MGHYDIARKNRTVLGCLQAVKSGTAAEVRLVDRETQGSFAKPGEQQKFMSHLMFTSRIEQL